MWGMNEILYLCLVSVFSVVVLFFIAKILGKKQIAQLEFIDYVLGISVGSIAAEMATDIGDKPFYYYIIAMVIYLVLDFLINIVGRLTPSLKHFFKGKPITIIYEGKIVYKNLKKSKIDVNDVISMARIQGYFDLSDIAYGIFENNGDLSILPKSSQKPTVAEDIKLSLPPASLPCYMVIDGRISFSSLTELKKDTAWLFSKLNIQTKAELKKIILAIYDENSDTMDISTKE